MSSNTTRDQKFGSLAIEKNYVTQEKMDRALVVQKCVFERSGVHMPIGEILTEMGILTQDQRKDILFRQANPDADDAGTEKSDVNGKSADMENPSEDDDKSLDMEITIDKAKMAVHAFLNMDVPVKGIDAKEVIDLLGSKGVVYGIAEEPLIDAFLAGEFGVAEQWQIATGLPPVPDQPPEIRCLFDTDPMKVGTLSEDGRMDWKERGEIPQVKEGDRIAEKIPGVKGEAGMDVFGSKVPPPKAKDKRIKCGKGAKRSKDGNEAFASACGMPKVYGDGELTVIPTLKIRGDIGVETGHVEFDGHIEVSGSVESGYRVKGASLWARELQKAEIEIEGDVMAQAGIFGSKIVCDGNLKAGHINGATIEVGGNMAVEREIFESVIQSNGACSIGDGKIVSSRISAKKGIKAFDVGTEAAKPSALDVGIDHKLQKEIQEARAVIKQSKEDKQILVEEVEQLQTRSDELNTELGELAQEQDACMVQHRRIEEQMESIKAPGNASAKAKLDKTIENMKKRMKGYEKQVEEMLTEDDQVAEDLDKKKAELSAIEKEIDRLSNHVDVLMESSQIDKGIPVLKVSGTIYSGTIVSGPHCMITTQEDFSGVRIAESDRPDATGAKKRHMAITVLR